MVPEVRHLAFLSHPRPASGLHLVFVTASVHCMYNTAGLV